MKNTQMKHAKWRKYHCCPEPRGPPANIIKRGNIFAVKCIK